ncbi:MAG: nucleotidyltransferase domain-containing protein [Trichlorobacter sp.]|uniref:type VII toxin-antitoxin system MntA family adenylyltransferase antitoxin n=1 Tax=Trichlorobacter sp. TaxID=2911007 RepID=UPI00255F053F|nr:nucleotidyltransferase domain-containing protein [Trichlorobacter sp.]MDK9718787.1 nucleotidyltransferase domain-containing protein [Trichlorobacter sp.]
MSTHMDLLASLLSTIPDLELAVLIGSRATGFEHAASDWDIAVQWSRNMEFMEQLAANEQLRTTLSSAFIVFGDAIDLIDMPKARLAMRATIAEEGIPLKGGGSLAWHHFLQRTWRELEEHYWEQIYAA